MRKDIEIALDEASDVPQKNRSYQAPSTELRKKQKVLRSDQQLINPIFQGNSMAREGEASQHNAKPSLILDSSAPQAVFSDNSLALAGINASAQCHHASDHSFTGSITQSEAPVIWENWDWIGEEL